jgi:hypothetical protein
MVEKLVRSGRLDTWAMAVSGLCFAHCVLTAAILAGAASLSLSPIVANPIIHEVGLAIAIILGAIALGFGLRSHGRVGPALVGTGGLTLMVLALYVGHAGAEIPLTMAGVCGLLVAHLWNRSAART